MSIYTMKCVGYDNDFQRDLSEKFPIWVPPAPRPRKKPGNDNPSSKTKAGGRKPRLKKRKHEVTPESAPESQSDLADKPANVDPPVTLSRKRKRKAISEPGLCNDSESDSELEHVNSPVARFRTRTRSPDDGGMDIDHESGDDLEYVEPPRQPIPTPRKRFSATSGAILDMGSESDDDALEYIDPPVTASFDEIIDITDEKQVSIYRKLGDGTIASPIRV